MNVLEAIERKKHEAQRLHLAERRDAETARNQLALQKKSNASIRLARGQERRKNQELRREENLSRTKELFDRSGLLDGLQKIEQKYLTRFTKHNLLIHYETGEAILVWGNKFEATEGNIDIDYEHKKESLLSKYEIYEIDCRLIYIHVNFHSGSIKLSGSEKLNKKAQSPHLGFKHEQQNLRQNEWENNLGLVSEALGTAFLYPVKLKDKFDTHPSEGPSEPYYDPAQHGF